MNHTTRPSPTRRAIHRNNDLTWHVDWYADHDTESTHPIVTASRRGVAVAGDPRRIPQRLQDLATSVALAIGGNPTEPPHYIVRSLERHHYATATATR